jgi:hypothetical protein
MREDAASFFISTFVAIAEAQFAGKDGNLFFIKLLRVKK